MVGELTVPWEDNIDECHESKGSKYLDLVQGVWNQGMESVLFPL